MTKENFSRGAAILSQVIIILWFALQLSLGHFIGFWRSIFGDTMFNGIFIIRTGYTDFIPLYRVYAMFICAVILIAANIMIIRGKCKRAPLIISTVTTVLLPIASKLLTIFQEVTLRRTYGDNFFIGIKGTVMVSYVLYAGAVLAIAAAAAYLFSKGGNAVRAQSNEQL